MGHRQQTLYSSSSFPRATGGRDFSGEQVDRYLLSSILGKGAAGSVYKAVDLSLEDSPTFAVKCMRESRIDPLWDQQMAEINNHRDVSQCAHVLTLHDTFDYDGYFFLVLPLCEIDMFRAIWAEYVYWQNDALIKEAFTDLVDGVYACHKKGIYHRDLKPENIMCQSDGTHIMIGDFGLSTNRRVNSNGACGTAAYMSPECWDRAGSYYNDLVDVWALGVILFNMVTCRYPWEEARSTDKDYRAFLSDRAAFLRRYALSEPLRDLLGRMWDATPMERPTIPGIRKAIVEMEFFYDPLHESSVASVLAAELVLVDSQQTCVAFEEDTKKKDARVAALDVIPLYTL